jgi:hypothetical protein
MENWNRTSHQEKVFEAIDRIHRILIGVHTRLGGPTLRFDSNTEGTEKIPGENGVGKIWIAGRKYLTIGGAGV